MIKMKKIKNNILKKEKINSLIQWKLVNISINFGIGILIYLNIYMEVFT